MPVRIEIDSEPIPGYRLISRLGGGGYGDVWKCEAPGGLHKAIKFVFGSLAASESAIGDDNDAGRAEQELKSLERIKTIRHPFILALDRYEIIDGQLMIVTELADCSLYDRYREYQKQKLRGIPREELFNYMLETAEALDYMTEKHDLLHLDVKPQNLFLLCNHIKIGDFGLVKDVQGKLANVTGGFTTIYAAPESFEGYVSRFSDQYSLAIVFQELLTGQRPFSGTNPKQLLLQHLQGQPNLDPLPEHDREIIARALSKTPSERWPSSMAMMKALMSAEEQNDSTIQTVMSPTRDSETHHDMHELAPERVTLHLATRVNRHVESSDSPPGMPSESLTKLRSAHLNELGIAAASESGVLRPVVLIGLGQFGRVVLQKMKAELKSLYGSADFPLMKMLAIDTEAPALSDTMVEQRFPEDLLLMPLSRPTRYLRARDELPPIDSWLDANVLYRMPRNLVTNGIRCLGRLAFIEHYQAFVTRFERELNAVLSADSQAEACAKTGLTIRQQQPLIYVITHLSGGTGSGMFLDCAYVARSILKQRGYSGEVAGIMLTPDLHDVKTPDLPEANAVAALHELFHYQERRGTFQAQYQSKMSSLESTVPPFSHCLFVETPSKPGKLKHGQQDPAVPVINRLAYSLSRVLLTSLGQACDPSWLSQSSQAMYQSLATRIVASSRQSIIQQASKSACNMVIDHWLKPLTPEQTTAVQDKMNNLLSQELLHPTYLNNYLDKAVANALEMNSTNFAKILLHGLMVPIKEKLPDLNDINKALKEILNTLGITKADDSVSISVLNPNTRVSRVLREAVDQQVQASVARLKKYIYHLVDVPNFRLSAADEALRFLAHVMEKSVQRHDQLNKQFQELYAESLRVLKNDLNEYNRIRHIAKFRWPKLPSAGERLFDIYNKRYEALLHERIAAVYSGIGSQCVGMLQELRQCRTRLLDLRQSHRVDSDLIQSNDPISGNGKTLLMPMGYTDLYQVVQQTSQGISTEDLESIDSLLAERLSSDYPKMMELSQSGGEALQPLRQLIKDELSIYLDQHLPTDDLVTLFIEQHPNVCRTVETLHAEAELPVNLLEQTKAFELVFLMFPESDQVPRIEQELKLAFTELVTLQSKNSKEVVVHRAFLGIQLHELSVMNPDGMAAYETAQGIEHFTPHARQDIQAWESPLNEVKTAQLVH